VARAEDADLKGSIRPSLRDVATRAGVSTASASNLLSIRRDDPIGRAVLAAAKDLVYRADAIAAERRLKARPTRSGRVACRFHGRGRMVPP
jgi:DNA-binding LacI/PurR family transcriptional regulator